jgi:hypothetical protein
MSLPYRNFCILFVVDGLPSLRFRTTPTMTVNYTRVLLPAEWGLAAIVRSGKISKADFSYGSCVDGAALARTF